MKTLFSSIALLIAFTGFAQTNSETRTVSDFTGIKSSSGITIEITQADVNAVVLEGDADDLKTVTTQVDNGILSISGGSGNGVDEVKAKISMKNLRTLIVSGNSSISSTNKLAMDSLRLVCSGASEIKLDVQATTINCVIAGASNVKLSGSTNLLNAQVAGAGDLKAYHLAATEVIVMAAGAANVHVSPINSLDASAAGASDIFYQGNPTIKNSSATGGSSIVKRNEDNKSSSDTTKIRMGNYDVSVTGHDGDDERSEREKKADDDDFKFWQGLDFGVNGFLTADNKVELPTAFNFMELNYAKSYSFSWNMFQKNIHIYRNNVNLGTGIGFSWYHYNFRNSYTLTPNVPFATATLDSVNYKRNRLGMTYVNVPLLLEFNTNNNDASNSFHFGAGMEFGYNVFNNVLKQKYELDGHTYKSKQKDDFNVNPFRYDMIARVGYGDFTIFAKYSLSTLFEKGKGPTVYPFSAGIHIGF